MTRLLQPLEEAGGVLPAFRRLGWSAPAALGVALLLLTALPVSAEFSLHSPEPAPELPDGSPPKLALTVGSGPDIASWALGAAANALPPPGTTTPGSASARVWVLPALPPVSIPSNVTAFNPKIDQQTADLWAHDVVLDLVIESEARRAHDLTLAQSGATGDGLAEFVDVINQDIAAGKSIQKVYSFDSIQLQLFLPKFSTQARRLIGVTLRGTTTLITRDPSGNVLSQTRASYAKSWGLGGTNGGTNLVIVNDFTDLTPA